MDAGGDAETAYLQRHKLPELIDAAIAAVLDQRPEGIPGGVCGCSAYLHHFFERRCVDRRHPLPGVQDDDEAEEGEKERKPSAAAQRPHPLSVAVPLPHAAELRDTIAQLRTAGKGVVIADDCHASVETTRRLRHAGVDNSEESRRGWREAILAHEGLADYASAVILHDEALGQVTDLGRPFPKFLQELTPPVAVGVAADGGEQPLPGGAPGETGPAGLAAWPARARRAFAAGARVARCRAAYRVRDGRCSEYLLAHNAHALAAFAAAAQTAGLVPVAAVCVLREGAHDAGTAELAAARALAALAAALPQHGAAWELAAVEVSLALPGAAQPERVTASEAARGTLRALGRAVPPACGAVFVGDNASVGGAAETPDEVLVSEGINAVAADRPCWPVRWCLGQALQRTALAAWGGQAARAEHAQRAFLLRCRMNFMAAQGRHVPADDDREMRELAKGPGY